MDFDFRRIEELVTKLVQAFCDEHSLALIAAAVDRHGSTEWLLGEQAELERILSLSLTETSDEDSADCYEMEVSATVSDGKKYLRALLSSRTFQSRDLLYTVFPAELSQALSHSWSRAREIQRSELTTPTLTTAARSLDVPA